MGQRHTLSGSRVELNLRDAKPGLTRFLPFDISNFLEFPKNLLGEELVEIVSK